MIAGYAQSQTVPGTRGLKSVAKFRARGLEAVLSEQPPVEPAQGGLQRQWTKVEAGALHQPHRSHGLSHLPECAQINDRLKLSSQG